jgi:hypothetical protein
MKDFLCGPRRECLLGDCMVTRLYNNRRAVFLCCVVRAATIEGRQFEGRADHDNENVRTIRQGEPRHKKYKRLKLGGGQAYDHSSD